MIRTDMNDISDDEFDEIVLPCIEKLHDYVVNNFLNEYVATHMAVYFNGDAMWSQTLHQQLNSAVEDFSQFTEKDCDIEQIKKILKEKYKLKITNESPLAIEKIED